MSKNSLVLFAISALLVGIAISWLQFRSPTNGGGIAKSETQLPAVVNDEKQSADESIKLPVRIPFTLTDSNNISIAAVINDTDRLNLMFHTAMGEIALTDDAVEKMKSVSFSESTEVQSWGGSGKTRVSTDNKLSLGELEWSKQTIYTDTHSGPGTDGKFGPDLFQGKILEVNFDSRELIVYSSLPDMVMDTAKYHRLDFTENRGSMYVAGTVGVADSKLNHSFMVHSGFGGTVLLDDEFVTTHELATKLETISERELKDSFGNIIKTRKVRLNSLEIAGRSFSGIPIEIFDGSIGRQKVSVLGGDLLRRFNMVIDSANHHIYFAPNTLSDLPFSI